jgi:hypothetical protein
MNRSVQSVPICRHKTVARMERITVEGGTSTSTENRVRRCTYLMKKIVITKGRPTHPTHQPYDQSQISPLHHLIDNEASSHLPLPSAD